MSDVMRATCMRARLPGGHGSGARWVVRWSHKWLDVARGSVGGVTGNVFEEVEERFAHPSVCVHHERDEFLVHCARRGLILTPIL
jgi:hypothetical protein